jgi:hypothetical protein
MISEVDRPFGKILIAPSPMSDTVHKSFSVVLALLLAMCPALSARAQDLPRLEVKVIDKQTVVVRGFNFPPGQDVDIEVTMNQMHASVACMSEFSRRAYPQSSSFEVVVNPSTVLRGCSFTCGADKVGWLVIASAKGMSSSVEREFSCVSGKPATGKQ